LKLIDQPTLKLMLLDQSKSSSPVFQAQANKACDAFLVKFSFITNCVNIAKQRKVLL